MTGAALTYRVVYTHACTHTHTIKKEVGGWSVKLILPTCLCSPQEKNSALALENETQREQYERCLDEVKIIFGHLEAS